MSQSVMCKCYSFRKTSYKFAQVNNLNLIEINKI